MKLILLLVILLFCSTFAHEEACKTNEDCPKHQFCTNHNHCHNKFQEFCQNSLTCKLQFGKDTYCSLKDGENYGKCLRTVTSGGSCMSNRECTSKEYCTGDLKKKTVGKCVPRPKDFCQNLTQCDATKLQICKKETCN
jgi:hypothetical protein